MLLEPDGESSSKNLHLYMDTSQKSESIASMGNFIFCLITINVNSVKIWYHIMICLHGKFFFS